MSPVSVLGLPFSVAGDHVSGATIAPAGTASLSVVFAPTDGDSFADSLVLTSNDPDTPAFPVTLTGFGASKAAPGGHGSRHIVGGAIYDFITGGVLPRHNV
jgi:hypothetical protein